MRYMTSRKFSYIYMFALNHWVWCTIAANLILFFLPLYIPASADWSFEFFFCPQRELRKIKGGRLFFPGRVSLYLICIYMPNYPKMEIVWKISPPWILFFFVCYLCTIDWVHVKNIYICVKVVSELLALFWPGVFY